MMLKFLSLASGSNGNCYYFGTPEYGVLFDAGIPFRSIKQALHDNGIDMKQIMAVFVTHDHTDHIKSVGVLGEGYGIPVYATEAVHYGIAKSTYVEEKLTTSRRVIEKEKAVEIKEFTITAFEVPHDASDCVGYWLQYGEQNCILATDIGHITEKMCQYMRLANHLIIEANYDREMMQCGNYPESLKNRITDGKGHLCNADAADYLAKNFDSRLRNIWLCHLSRDNNHPDLACKTVEIALGRCGVRVGQDVQLTALRRLLPSDLYELN